MVYADYEYYSKKYFGTLPEDSFNSLILKASREIDTNINTRLNQTKINNLEEEAQEQLKYTACALVDLIYKKQERNSKEVNSISIDGISKTFKTMSDDEYKSSKNEILKFLPYELTRYLQEVIYVRLSNTTSITSHNRNGSNSTDNALIRIFDVKEYNSKWFVGKDDIIVNQEVSDVIEGNTPLTQLSKKYDKDNVHKVTSIDKFLFDDEDLEELNHIKFGCI